MHTVLDKSTDNPKPHTICLFLPQYQRQRKCFWVLKKALLDALTQAALCGLLSTTANYRLVALVLTVNCQMKFSLLSTWCLLDLFNINLSTYLIKSGLVHVRQCVCPSRFIIVFTFSRHVVPCWRDWRPLRDWHFHRFRLFLCNRFFLLFLLPFWLRKDYTKVMALTCIWGNFDRVTKHFCSHGTVQYWGPGFSSLNSIKSLVCSVDFAVIIS